MPAHTKRLEADLHGMVRRIRADSEHGIRGVIQLASSDEPALSFYITAQADEVAIHSGAHPAPDVRVAAPTQVFLNMFAGKFAFFDPDALSYLEIEGDPRLLLPLFGYIGDSDQKLIPFELAASVRTSRARSAAIPRIERPTERDLLDAIADYQPLLITGAVAAWDWPCKSWTPDYLVQAFGNERLTSADHTTDAETETVASFIARSREGGSRRSTAGLLPRNVRNAAGYPGYFQPCAYRWPFFFMGDRGAVSPIHRDLAHNLAVHLFGRKHWLLFPPEQAELLYARRDPGDGPSAQTCAVDIEAPDRERFPLYAEARPIEVLVEGGEILFVPSGWFHHVRSIELTLNVAYSLKWDKGQPGEIKVDTPLIDLTAGEEDG